MFSFLISLLTFSMVFNITLFYLDDFKLSENKYIRLAQNLSPLLLVFLIILFYYQSTYIFNEILFLDGSSKDNISIGAKVEIGKDAATEISKGISSLGSNVGLAGTVGGVTAGVAKVISKSSLPPIQKAGIVVSGSLIGAGIHLGASAINKSTGSTTPTQHTGGTGINISDNVSKLLPDYTENSALMDLTLSVNMITFACFSLIIILFMMILFKFYLELDPENKIKLNLSSWIGDKLNISLNFYLIKLIKLNKNTSSVYIFIILFLLLVGLGFDCYFLNHLLSNLDKLIYLHINR